MKDQWPEVAVIVAAYNEASLIMEKVNNCLALEYPNNKIRYYFVTDGSTDGTDTLLAGIDGITVFHSPERKGKLAAVERIMKSIVEPIVVLTDANCLLNTEALKLIVRHYSDPAVGAVSGEKKIRKHAGSLSSAGEGLYWKYESWLKKIDSKLYSVVGAAGELFSFRRSLFEELPADTIIEDFVLSMRIGMKGFRIVYEPEAVASEFASASLNEEWKRKVRICAGAFQALEYLPEIWNPFKYGWLSIQFLSHRFLRWFLIPFLLPVVLVVAAVLGAESAFYQAIFFTGLTLIILGIAGTVAASSPRLPKIMMIASYFLMMNAAAYAGLYRHLKGTQSAVWEKSKRIHQPASGSPT